MQQNPQFTKLSQFHIALIFQFLHGAQLLSNISLVSKSFNAIIKKDLIWRNQCHSIFNFTRKRAELNQTWLDCFIRKCKSNIRADKGTANQSFLMTPLRGHKAFITANTIQQDLIVSGDNQGIVRAWLLDPSDYQDSDPAQLIIYQFKPWQQKLITGEVVNHQYTRVDRVWILDNSQDDEDLYFGDDNHNSKTIVAVSGRQVCILKIEIEGFVPPKFIQQDQDSEQSVIKLIQITEIKQISQIGVIKRKIKVQQSEHSNSNNKAQNVLVIAPNYGYTAFNSFLPLPQTKLLLIDLVSGQKMALIDLAQGLPNMQHKRILNGNQPQLQLPGVFQPRIQAIHQDFLNYFDQIDKKFKQLIKLNNRQELCYCLNNGMIQKINLKTLKIIHQQDTQILRNDNEVIILCMGQDSIGSYIYVITHSNADNRYELVILSQNSLKVLGRIDLDDVGVGNIGSSYFRIQVCKFQLDQVTRGELQTGLVNNNGNLVIILLGGIFFSCYLHTTGVNQMGADDDEQEAKQNQFNAAQKLIKIKREKKKKTDYQRNIYNLQQLAKYGTVFDFNVFKRKNIVTAHSQDVLKVSKIRTGEEIFVLRGGSKISHPKSYVKNPERDGFAYSTISEDKILGVRGNLIRVFSFDA